MERESGNFTGNEQKYVNLFILSEISSKYFIFLTLYFSFLLVFMALKCFIKLGHFKALVMWGMMVGTVSLRKEARFFSKPVNNINQVEQRGAANVAAHNLK